MTIRAIALLILGAPFLGATFLGAASLGAQARPSTDVWVVPMRQQGSVPTFGSPVNATHRTGYDNQPSFTPKGDAVLYTVIGADGAADIWRFPLPVGTARQVTATKESEYSAAVTPDGNWFSVIRVEADSTQRLWKFPVAGGEAPVVVLEKIKPVGYHVWAGSHTLVLFVLGDPPTLQIADDRTGTGDIVAKGIGRALAKVPGRDAVTFLQLNADSASWISELDVRTRAIRRVAAAPAGADYHVWTPNGVLLAASGSRILAWVDGRWDVAADLGRYGVHGLSRLAVSPKGDWLAFVAEDKPAP
jgi:hypothetical protein